MPHNLHITVPRLGRNRHGVFFVRSPSFIDASGRRRVMQQSLRTKNPAVAKILALEFCLKVAGGNQLSSDPRFGISPWTAKIDAGEFSAEGPGDTVDLIKFMEKLHELGKLSPREIDNAISQGLLPSTTRRSQPISDHGQTLQTLVALHLQKEASVMASSQTVHEKKVLLDDFMAVFGENTGIRQITAELITTRWIPEELSRPNKKYKDKTLSLARLEKRRTYLSKFFTWAKASGFYQAENPMAVKMATKKEIKAKTKSYAEFTTDDLSKLFGVEYKQFMNKPDWYWPPLLALFSGARLGELCNLQVQVIKEIEGIKTYEIFDGKTPDSPRIVPIHPILVELGFWEYVVELRQRQETYLFPDRTSRDAVEKALGRRWGRWIDVCGITDKRKVFHSFRSTAITDLHNASAGAAAIRKAVGHTSAGVDGAHGGYVRGQLLTALVDAIGKLQYSAVNFVALKLQDPTFGLHFEAINTRKNNSDVLERVRKKAANLAAREARLGGTLHKAG